MFKKLLAFIAAMSVVAAFAAVDVNKATEAELDGIKGIGPVTTKLIVSERKKGDFKSWEDFISRVKGVGDNSAAKFSAAGLTVSGSSYTGTGAAKAKVEAKADAKADKKPVAEKAKDAAVATKDAVKGAAVKTGEAVKETAKDAKAAVTPNKEVKTEVKVEAAKPAASAAKK
ncbi:MAG: hypothetical protein EOO28_12765 [Comamonadaceae bacterium]|nr:MAG: hypothetical protein EOO28_12765 [Comamonadaceae bacterium]